MATSVAINARDNGGCTLPCYWGIEPGVTRWRDALDRLWDFSPYVITFQDAAFEGYSRGQLRSAKSYSLESVDLHGNLIALSNYRVVDAVVDTIYVAPFATAYLFDIGSVLADYGEPTQALVATYSDYFGDGVLTFWLLLYYPEVSTVLIYEKQAHKVDDRISVCFNGNDGPTIHSWLIGDTRPLEALNLNIPLQRMRPLEEATALTIPDLRARYGSHRSWACLESPASLWPPQD